MSIASVRTSISIVILLFGVAASLAAQAPHGADFVRVQQTNNAALRGYSWKSRTELRVKGETKKVTLEQVRFDFDGRLQKTRIGGTAEEQAAGRGRGRGPMHRIAAKKIERFKEQLGELAALAASYGHLSQDRLQSFARAATITRGEGAYAGTMRLDGHNVLIAGDAMTVWIDPATLMTRHVEIKTMFEDDPLSLTADYRTIVAGPTYQARTTLRYPEDEIEINVENFDYELVATTH